MARLEQHVYVRRRATTALCVVLVAILAIFALLLVPSQPRPRIIQTRASTQEVPPAVWEFLDALEATKFQQWLDFTYAVRQYLVAMVILDYLATLPPPPSDCFAQPWVPAYIVSRESGGDPYIINGGGHAPTPYASGGRAWGCFQFMPGTWNGNCADLGYDVSSQIECARRVSSNGTNLRPWSLY